MTDFDFTENTTSEVNGTVYFFGKITAREAGAKMAVEYRAFGVTNMDIDNGKTGNKQFVLDGSKLRNSGNKIKT